MSIGNELIGKTIAYARVNGFEVMLIFEDGTTFDYTAYEIYGSKDILEDVKHLLDFVQDKTITQEIVDNEKGIIVEEVKMDGKVKTRELAIATLKGIGTEPRDTEDGRIQFDYQGIIYTCNGTQKTHKGYKFKYKIL